MNHLSKTSKLNAKSWSLQAWDTCPGAKDANGEAVPACAGCYARTGCYVFPGVKKNREENRQAWREAGWVDLMVAELEGEELFRWFDSGDVYHADLAEKIYQVIERTPNTKHWLPTRSYKIERIRVVLERIKTLPNAAVRYSSDSIGGDFAAGLHGSTILPSAENVPAGVFLCGAYSRGGKCGDCSACYSKSVEVIGYPAHGRTMAKLIRIESAKAA